MPRRIVAALLLLAVPSVASAQSGAQITIAQPAEATTMDPGRSTQVLTVNYFYNLYDALLRWDNTLKLQPGLATSWKSVNDTTWEFSLRQGVKFHDGQPFTAEDVKATLERNLVVGKTVVQSGFATIDAVQIVNPTTVRVITKKPDPLLLVRMAQMGAQILPARLTTDEGMKELARKPVGTGAYRFVEWVKDERLVMDANRDWWGWEGKTPAIERVIWKPIPDDFPRLVALEKGEVDIITNVPPDRMQAIADGRTTRIVTTPSTRLVTFDHELDPAAAVRRRVRQALHYALDVNAIVKNLYAGQGRPFSGGLADTDFGYNPALKPYAYDPAKAKQLLGEAGRRDRYRRDAPRGQRHHGERQVPSGDDRRHVGQGGHPRQGRDDGDGSPPAHAQRARHSPQRAACWVTRSRRSSTPTAASGGSSIPTASTGKYWIGSQPGQRFHDLMESARYSLDQKKRKQLYADATQIIHDEKPWLELFQEIVVYGTSKRVTFTVRPDYRLIVSEMSLAR